MASTAKRGGSTDALRIVSGGEAVCPTLLGAVHDVPGSAWPARGIDIDIDNLPE